MLSYNIIWKKEKEEIFGLTISKARLGVVEPRVASNYIRIYIYTHIVYYSIHICSIHWKCLSIFVFFFRLRVWWIKIPLSIYVYISFRIIICPGTAVPGCVPLFSFEDFVGVVYAVRKENWPRTSYYMRSAP